MIFVAIVKLTTKSIVIIIKMVQLNDKVLVKGSLIQVEYRKI